MNEHDPIWTATEASNYMQMPQETLQKWRHIGTGPDFLKIGRHVRYRKSAVDRWLDTRSRAQTG